MSTEILMAGVEGQALSDPGETRAEAKLPRCANVSPARPGGQIQRVWCAPMTCAGEWVITWTRAPEALSYEVQTSLGGNQWSDGSRFSGTRAVLLLGPARCFWARVRAVGREGPGPWSEPARAERGDGFSAAA
jgi:hypothetical protein